MDVAPIGEAGLTILVLALVYWLVPVAVVIWGMVTLFRIKRLQETTQLRLEAIEQLLRQR